MPSKSWGVFVSNASLLCFYDGRSLVLDGFESWLLEKGCEWACQYCALLRICDGCTDVEASRRMSVCVRDVVLVRSGLLRLWLEYCVLYDHSSCHLVVNRDGESRACGGLVWRLNKYGVF